MSEKPFKINIIVTRQWFMPVILVTQEVEIKTIAIRSQPGHILARPYLENTLHKNNWWSGSRCRPQVQAPVLQKFFFKCHRNGLITHIIKGVLYIYPK
jgi:hypothetical protein